MVDQMDITVQLKVLRRTFKLGFLKGQKEVVGHVCPMIITKKFMTRAQI